MGTRELAARLPDIETLRRWSRALAVLDAVLSPEWEYRTFSFDANWSDAEEMASMRNGSGDEYFIVFADAGVFIRGFDHESALSPYQQSPPAIVPGLVDEVPPSLRGYLNDPTFGQDGRMDITVCLWCERADGAWHWGEPSPAAEGDGDGGADRLFEQLDGSAATYARFAEDNFEVTVEIADVAHVFDHGPLTAELVGRLNPDVDPAAVLDEARSMGYPVG